MISRKIGLYIHIPFCIQKCQYCDFLSFPAGEEEKEQYVKQLLIEMKVRSANLKECVVDTVFLGGGTPSILNEKQIEKIMQGIFANFIVSEDAEITMEMNPKTVTEEKLKVCKDSGINRISFGVQSFDDKYLKLLGRAHSSKDFYENYQMARAVGFSNINVDLMSALPGQSLHDIQKTLQKVTSLSPEHISFYGLIVEEGTPFYEKYGEENRRREEGEERMGDELPGEQLEREMYQCICDTLQEHGYLHYEISNYGKPGFLCRHNLKYWERKEYLGLGLGAASLLENIRYANINDIGKYLETDFLNERDIMIMEKEVLDEKACMEEFMFLGLRKMKGISKNDFFHEFQRSYEEVYGAVHRELLSKGLLKEIGEYVSLSEKGIDVSNYVMGEYLL